MSIFEILFASVSAIYNVFPLIAKPSGPESPATTSIFVGEAEEISILEIFPLTVHVCTLLHEKQPVVYTC